MAYGKYVNPANAVTAARYLTLPPFLYWVDRGDVQFATAAVFVSAMMDLADGPIARKLKCTSGFGEMFDAVTDGICYAFVMVTVCAYGYLPWTPIVALLGLGLVNTGLRLLYSRRLGRTANFRSYGMEVIVGYAAGLSGLGLAGIEPNYFPWFPPALMFAIMIWDTKRMLIDPVPA